MKDFLLSWNPKGSGGRQDLRRTVRRKDFRQGPQLIWGTRTAETGSARTLFQDAFAHVCGLRVRPHIHFEGIVSGIDPSWLATNLKTLEPKLVQYFGPGSADLT